MIEKQPNPTGRKPGTKNHKRHPAGQLFVISAPSGTGKTTLCRAVLDHFPEMRYSASHTTRTPRSGERDHRDYHFITKDEFEKGIKSGRWAEWAVVHGNYYGTSAEYLERQLLAGRDILLDIDVQGTMQLLNRFDDSITIFIVPPSIDALRSRLTKRGTEDQTVIEQRLINARAEMAQKERYRHLIVNDRLEAATEALIALIESYRR